MDVSGWLHSASDWLNALGLLLSIVGFGIAIWQLQKTATAAQATQKAVEATAARLSLNHLLVLLPQLHQIEGDLDTSVADNDHRLAIRALVAYSHAATQIASLLEREDAAEHALLVTKLRDAVRSSSAVKSKLVTSGTAKPVAGLLRATLPLVSELSGEAAGLAAQIQVRGT